MQPHSSPISGGSVANSIGGLSGLGARTGFVGKVRDDQFGEVFAHDMRAFGASFDTPPAPAHHPLATGRSLIMFTPDGERSMNTYLGIAETLGPADIDPHLMAATEWGEKWQRPGPIDYVRSDTGANVRVGIVESDSGEAVQPENVAVRLRTAAPAGEGA